MKTSNPFSFAALKIRSMFSTVLFSLTLSPTAPHARPLSLKTSFCGSMKTTAVSFLCMFIVLLQSISQSPPRPFRSPLEEREQIRVDSVFVGRAHAVRQARIDFQRGALDDLGRELGRGADRHDLVVVAVQDQRRHVELLEILGEIRLGKRLDAKIGTWKTAHHPLEPERFAHAFRDLCARPVIAVERQAKILPELRAVGYDAAADLV